MGKPQVSCSRKALSPGSTAEPAALVSDTAVSRMLVPAFSVLRKAFSSARATFSIRSRSVISSGYCCPIMPMTTSMRSLTTGPVAPSRRMLRMARRMMRRST